jgi:arginyl-tRNA synthetase
MSFDPKETIDLSGHTGPFIQYTFVRIKSLLKKVEIAKADFNPEDVVLNNKELEVIKSISNFPKVIIESSKELSPYLLANYLYGLVKTYNAFYQEYPIVGEKNMNNKNFRIELSNLTSNIIERGMKLLGIEMPNRM